MYIVKTQNIQIVGQEGISSNIDWELDFYLKANLTMYVSLQISRQIFLLTTCY